MVDGRDDVAVGDQLPPVEHLFQRRDARAYAAAIDLLGWQAADARGNSHASVQEHRRSAVSRPPRSLVDHSAVPVPYRGR